MDPHICGDQHFVSLTCVDDQGINLGQHYLLIYAICSLKCNGSKRGWEREREGGRGETETNRESEKQRETAREKIQKQTNI